MNRKPYFRDINVDNFRCLSNQIDLRSVTVLTGDSGTGKTTVANVLRFLADVATHDLDNAVKTHGGLEGIGLHPFRKVSIRISGAFTDEATPEKHDVYTLTFGSDKLDRQESWHPANGKGFVLEDTQVVYPNGSTTGLTSPTITGLHLLSQFGGDMGADIAPFAEALKAIQFVSINPRAIGVASIQPQLSDTAPSFLEDGSNLSEMLHWLTHKHPAVLDEIIKNLASCFPWVRDLQVRPSTIQNPLGLAAACLLIEPAHKRVSTRRVADGVMEALALLTVLNTPGPNRLIVLDDLNGVSHHTSVVLQEAMEAAANSGHQVIACGRGEALENPQWVSDCCKIIGLIRDPEDGSISVKKIK